MFPSLLCCVTRTPDTGPKTRPKRKSGLPAWLSQNVACCYAETWWSLTYAFWEAKKEPACWPEREVTRTVPSLESVTRLAGRGGESMSGSRPPREDGKARGEGGWRPGLRDRRGAALAAAPRVLSACRADTRAGLALTDAGTAALNVLHGGLAGPNTCTALGGQSQGLGTQLGLALGPRPVTLGQGLL